MAATRGDNLNVHMLLAHGADVNAQNIQGWTPLARAVRYNHVGTVKVLLSNRADIEKRIDDGATSVIIAISEGHSGVLYELISNGADVNASNKLRD